MGLLANFFDNKLILMKGEEIYVIPSDYSVYLWDDSVNCHVGHF